MGRKQRERSEAVVRDMWDPYIVAGRAKVPHVKVVFDLFHVVAQFSRVIDKVLNSEYQKASGANKAVFKGVGYLLPRNRTNLCRFKGRRHLEELLRLNKVINAVLILKDKLKPIWTYKSRTWAEKAIDEWCALAKAVNHPAVRKFEKTSRAIAMEF